MRLTGSAWLALPSLALVACIFDGVPEQNPLGMVDGAIVDGSIADTRVVPVADLAQPWSADRYHCGAATVWSSFHANPRNTGFACALGAQTGHVAWQYSDVSGDYGGPVVATDGTIYVVGDVGNDIDGNLLAINSYGGLKWKFHCGASSFATPAIAPDGTILFGTDKSGLFAVTPEGALRWQFQQDGEWVYSAPTIAPDGTIYIAASYSSYLYALAPDGTQRWRFTGGGDWNSSAAVAGDGTVYQGNEDGHLYAIDSNGTQRWATYLQGAVSSSPVIAPDGTIAVVSIPLATGAATAWVLAPDGTVQWSARLEKDGFPNPNDPTPAIAPDGTAYYASQDGVLHAFAGDQPQWSIPNGSTARYLVGPAIGADGTIYVGDEYGLVQAISVGGQVVWSYQGKPNVIGYPAIGNGRLYVTAGATLTAFE